SSTVQRPETLSGWWQTMPATIFFFLARCRVHLTVNNRSHMLDCMNLQDHLAKIRAFYRSHKRMPSYSELTAVVGFRSKNAAYKLVTRLIEQGWLEKDAAGKLLPGRLFHTVPVLGTVTAGFPSPAEEELADTMSLDEFLITNKKATYILKVNGESMIEAGILSGDMLLVERGAEPRAGDIVIAQIGREWHT